MSDSLNAVMAKAKTDEEFASKLFMNPEAACQAAGISLNATEIKILKGSMEDTRKYFVERLFLATQGPDVLWNVGCTGCLSVS